MNLTRYIQSNPDLSDKVRPQFRDLEKSGELTEENFEAWESLFRDCETQFRKELKVIENGEEIESYEMWFPHPSELPPSTFLTMLEEGLHIKLYGTGKLSSDDAQLQFRFPVDVGEVALTSIQPHTQWVVTGEVSGPISMNGAALQPGETGGYSSSVLRYLRIGYYHILPLGLDHILFVFGLFLLSAKMRPLLIQVSAFTVAHTLTLGLSIYGVFSLPSGLVEPLIALSIVLVAVENILTDHIHPWRPVIVFVFGLLHGLGFAGVLGEIGLPSDEFLSALIFFNVGVELGQLTVVTAA
ncbi:MAG: HupE/UreJ family protein, partial [Verrucomicrobiae bacterium]|nr:HupE/UreJ family protein [Verrucomicrobiae bacterium]